MLGSYGQGATWLQVPQRAVHQTGESETRIWGTFRKGGDFALRWMLSLGICSSFYQPLYLVQAKGFCVEQRHCCANQGRRFPPLVEVPALSLSYNTNLLWGT